MTEEARDLKMLRWAVEGSRLFSTCGRHRHMAIVTDWAGTVVGVGYNGTPHGYLNCDAGGCPKFLGTGELCYGLTAEENALLHCLVPLRSEAAVMYVTGVPSWESAKLIANAGIRRLVYVDVETDEHDRVLSFLDDNGLELLACSLDLV